MGFITQTEKDWFNILRSVQGIGAKVALTILNTLDPKELLRAIRMKNELAFFLGFWDWVPNGSKTSC